VLSKEKGGRHTPFFEGYRAQFYFLTIDVTGSAKLTAGTKMVMAHDNISLEVTVDTPVVMAKGPVHRHPRRWSHRRRRNHLRNHQVTSLRFRS
jgi:translation elongation factor EF-Tu-like GTPase